MVEAIKNNGDRVVDTCVRDDTLNTTVTLNYTLATVSQTLLLGAKDCVTSDLVVPVINLESNQVSNSKLPTAGVLSGKDPILATIEDSGQANKVQQCEDNLDQIFEFGGNTKLQKLDCTNPTRKEQTINSEDKISSDQELHALSTPILQVSNPETTRIIKESHAAMLNKENSMFKPHMATINT
ncbi:hypothetical protein R3W88_004540 [Solanum pinnatisectum]|uniref:Uncharacterized protein n=1 Tax=Solanum pinnatisectum TaxID=50273 RepID=A0AAV9KA00_9SOLN|nr:hypothetical protein R3W88_004540 [Solanum pinnatisectum]